MNISKDLKGLFKEYMINKNKPITTNTTSYRNPKSYKNILPEDDEIKVWFYEWSNVTSTPTLFYIMESFEDFLKRSNIYLQLYEKDIIVNLGEVYVSCYRGTHRLCIRSSYKKLLDSMNDFDRAETEKDKKLLENLKGSKIPTPTYTNEGGYDGHWYG